LQKDHEQPPCHNHRASKPHILKKNDTGNNPSNYFSRAKLIAVVQKGELFGIDEKFSADYSPVISLTVVAGGIVEHSSLILIAEAIFRVIFGWRFLISGLSNVRRWPSAANTASILFPRGATFFGFVATVLMVVGGLGVAAGFQTPICSLMLIIFLIPTFNLHYYWLKVLPTMAPVVKSAITDEKAQSYFLSFDRQCYHAHEVGIRDNLVFLAAAIYFTVRGSGAFGLDNLLRDWVIRIF
jgi:uncharacterized membrane protein YphA (DoxX/SURF4 family)